MSRKKTFDEFLNEAKQKHQNKMYMYDKSTYINTHTPMRIICPKHGEFWQKPNDHLSKKGCPKCHKSLLEQEVERFLMENNIEYIPQYKTKWLGRQSLDFYLPDYKIAIECQGKQHFGVGGWGENFDYQNVKKLDIKKYKLCNKNGINLYYLMDKKNKSYITEDIIYIDRIFFNIKDLINFVIENKKGG